MLELRCRPDAANMAHMADGLRIYMKHLLGDVFVDVEAIVPASGLPHLRFWFDEHVWNTHEFTGRGSLARAARDLLTAVVPRRRQEILIW